MKKRDLRKKYYQIRKNIKNKKEKDYNIINNLCTLIKGYLCVGIYYAINNEPNIMKIINDSQTFYLPYCNKLQTMEYHEIIIPSFLNRLIKDEAGIPSIISSTNNNLDVVIAPAVAVNKQGFRIGYGGGYYDKFLAQSSCLKIVVVYDEQITDFTCIDEYDIQFDYIVSDLRIIKCK